MPVLNLTQALQPSTPNSRAERNRMYRQKHFEYTECSCGVILLVSSMHNHLKSKIHLTNSVRHVPSSSPT